MSVGIYKYDGKIDDINHKLVASKNIASETKYIKYLAPAIRKLNIKVFKDGSEIGIKDLNIVLHEIDLLIKWVENYVEGLDKEYLLTRLEDMKDSIPKLLNNENDILYIF